MIKKILIGLLVVLVALQAFRPEKNLSGDASKDISTLYPVPQDVQAILDRSCADCHTNKTNYPWYAEIQPVAWWLNDHVVDGKKHFNLNNFGNLRLAIQNHKLEECIEQVKEGEMPLESYTLIHTDAKLSENDKALITNWAQGIMDTLKARYPADSLVLKRPK
jgi:hypothetical protein